MEKNWGDTPSATLIHIFRDKGMHVSIFKFGAPVRKYS